MLEKVRTVRLYGVLGARFGRVHRLAVNSAAEAVRALSVLIPGFERFLLDSDNHDLEFAVFNGQRNLTREQLRDPPGNQDIRIAPVLKGAKKGGVLSTVIGVVLIVAGAISQNYGVVAAGVGMVLGGVSQMLAPMPKGLASKDSPAHRPNYAFNGPINTTAQGNNVPLLYGRMRIGSAVIGAGIYAEDQQ